MSWASWLTRLIASLLGSNTPPEEPHSNSALDLPKLPAFPNAAQLIIRPSSSIPWGNHMPSRAVVEQALSSSQDKPAFMATLANSLDLAKSVLAEPSSLPLITLRFQLASNSPEVRLIVALAVGVILHHINYHGEPNTLHLTRNLEPFLGSLEPATVLKRCDAIVDRAAAQMCESLKTVEVNTEPDTGEPVWLVDCGHEPAALRTLIFSKGATSKEHERAFLIVLYGFSQVQVTRALSLPKGAPLPEDLVEQLSRARLLLAAGTFPQPGTFGESRRRGA